MLDPFGERVAMSGGDGEADKKNVCEDCTRQEDGMGQQACYPPPKTLEP